MAVYNKGLPRGMTRNDSSIAAADYHIYNFATANLKMQKKFRESFNPIGLNKFTVIDGCHKQITRKIEGKVIFKSEYIVVIKMEKYTEAFTMASFFIKDIVMIGGSYV